MKKKIMFFFILALLLLNIACAVDFTSMSDEAYIAYGTRKGWLKQIQADEYSDYNEYFPGYKVLCPAKQCTIAEIDKNFEFFEWYNRDREMYRSWIFGDGNKNYYPDGLVGFYNEYMVVGFNSSGPGATASFARFLGNLAPNNIGNRGIVSGKTTQRARLNNIEVLAWETRSIFSVEVVVCTLKLKE
jgi:hypothetical protein